MYTAVKYVIKENLSNTYRIYSIAKADLLDDIKSNKLGLLWNFLSPTIQMLTYWLVFGYAMRRGGITLHGQKLDYMSWFVVGYSCWWFAQPCLTGGCKAISCKFSIIESMKFPVSILPCATVCKELFNHLCICVIAGITLLMKGHYPNIYWLQLLYYMFATFCLAEALALVLSVLTMKARDTYRWVTSFVKMLFYFTPLIWNCEVQGNALMTKILKLNPYAYLVKGYRESIFYNIGFWEHPTYTLYFWAFVIVAFVLGCVLMYRNQAKFMNMK